MEVQVRVPSPPLEFNFHSGRSSPCSTSPSTPRAFGDQFCFLSAPTSPNRASELYRELSLTEGGRGASGSAAPAEIDDFAFHVIAEAERPSASAEELFDSGRIRSLNAPGNDHSSSHGAGGGGRMAIEPPTLPRNPLLSPVGSPTPTSSKSKVKKGLWSLFTPKRRKQTNPDAPGSKDSAERTEQARGRERVSPLSKSSSVRRGARSLSPIRVSKYPWEVEKKAPQNTRQPASNSKPPPSSTALTLSTSSRSSRRWRLKDLLLFRSASEGRAADKDLLRKFTALYNRQEEARSSSFRGAASSASRRGPISAHERHYTLNKAASDDMKKKTFLPYKQGILGFLAVTPAAHGFGSFPSG